MLGVRKKSQWIFLRLFSCWAKIPDNPQKLSIFLGILLFCQHGVPIQIWFRIFSNFVQKAFETNSIPPRIFDSHLLKPSCKKIVASVAPAAFSEHFAFPPGEWHHSSAASYGSGPLQAPSYMTAKLLDRCFAPVAYSRWMTCAASCGKKYYHSETLNNIVGVSYHAPFLTGKFFAPAVFATKLCDRWATYVVEGCIAEMPFENGRHLRRNFFKTTFAIIIFQEIRQK